MGDNYGAAVQNNWGQVVNNFQVSENTARELSQLLSASRHAPIILVPSHTGPNFVGRDDHISKLQKFLTSRDHDRFALVGLAGMGKSRIARQIVEIAREHREHRSRSIFWVDASSRQNLEASYSRIARRLPIPDWDQSAPVTDKLRRVKDFFEADDMGPWLWIVDNADDISLLYGTKGSGLLKEHLPCFGDGKIILTTNDRQVARCFCTVIHRVESFTDPECEQLLSTQLDRKQLNGPHERSRLYEALQRLPLALVQAIAFIGAHQSSVKEYMKLYTGCERNRARLLNENPSGANPVTDAFEISFQMLERQCPRASTLLSTMSLFNHRAIPQRLLENLYPWSDLDMADACGKLEAYSLVTSYTVESSAPQCRAFRFYDLHQLVWLAMRHRLNLRKRSYRVIGKLKLPDITEGDFQLWATFITHLESLLSLTKKSRSRSQYHPSVHRKLEAGRLHFDLGKSLQQLGMYRSAEKQHRYALKLADRFLGKTDPHTLDVQRSLGLALVYQNKLTEAETLYRQILKLAKDLQDPSTLGDLSMLSLIFNSRGRYWQKKATRLQKRVLRQRTEKLSELHEDTLASKNSLGLIMASRCKFREAELLFECTLRKRKDLLGGTHRSTLSTMSNLAMVLDSLNYPQKAEALQQTAFTRRKQTLGISHPQTLASMNHLAKLLDDQGCYSDAAQMFLEIYKLRAASVIWWEV